MKIISLYSEKKIDPYNFFNSVRVVIVNIYYEYCFDLIIDT